MAYLHRLRVLKLLNILLLTLKKGSSLNKSYLICRDIPVEDGLAKGLLHGIIASMNEYVKVKMFKREFGITVRRRRHKLNLPQQE